MTKSILLSIRPEWVAKILNGEKTIEIRRKFPKNYVGWVYVYCTKNAPYLYYDWNTDVYSTTTLNDLKNGWSRVCNGANRIRAYQDDGKILTNGHILARFWCDKVEEINSTNLTSFEKKSCVDRVSMLKYFRPYLVWNNKFEILLSEFGYLALGYAIPITQLEIFDRPKELREFHTSVKKEPPEKMLCSKCGKPMEYYEYKYLHKPPQNYCYIDEEE